MTGLEVLLHVPTDAALLWIMRDGKMTDVNDEIVKEYACVGDGHEMLLRLCRRR